MSSEITLRHLQYLVAAVEEGTMAAAATRLGVSHSAVSMGIGDLESAAGAPLLLRVPRRKLQLTGLGAEVFADARSVVETAARIEHIFRAGRQRQGTVNLSCFAPFAPFLVPDLLNELERRAPDLEVNVSEDPVEMVFPRLLDGTIDVAVMYQDRMPDGLAFEPITTHYPYVIVADGHRLAGKEEIDLLDLVDDPFVFVKQRDRSYFEQLIAHLGVHPRSQKPAWNVDTMRTIVGRNEAWSLMVGPRPMSENSPEGLPIHAAKIANRVPPARPIMVWASETERSAHVKLVCDVLPDVFRSGRFG